jgi:hypothetical protein
MRKYLMAFGLSVVLGACSEKSKVKEAAVLEAKAQIQTEIKAEMAKAVTGKLHIQATAVRVLIEKSDFNVQKVEIQGDHADALVEVLTVPVKARVALMEIMEKLDEKKEDRFNVPDALKLILQRMDLSETRSLFTYKIKLEKTDGWQAVQDKK